MISKYTLFRIFSCSVQIVITNTVLETLLEELKIKFNKR